MIFFANRWTGFHMIGTSVMEELETKRIFQTHMNSQKALSLWIADSFYFLFNLHLDLRQYLTWTVKVNTIRQNPQAYSEICQTSSIERFVNIFSRCPILDFWQGFEYSSEIWKSLWTHHERNKACHSAAIILAQVNNWNNRIICETCLTLTIKKPGDFNFEQILHIILGFPLLTLNK